jgi:uncharacterized protein YdiU (UPF0061 family)
VPRLLVSPATAHVNYQDVLTKLIGDDTVRTGSSQFYEELPARLRAQWLNWIKEWRDALAKCYSESQDVVVERMQNANPKHVPRLVKFATS